jgi:ABC-2 type transport system ATP-binding protein
MIEIRDLTKKFDKTVAVNHLSLRVESGDVFGFIGPNGAGKTTTMRILATLQDPDSGTILVDDTCVINYPEKVRKTLGFMPDYYGVYDGMTIQEYLEFFAGAYRVAGHMRPQVVSDVMDLTDLGQIRDKLVAGLSKGMKQRLCLARALVHDPKVLVLDEPAAGLDPRARIELRVLLKELQKIGKTIFISSHVLTELADVCNKVAIIERGRLVASGSVHEINKMINPTRTLVIGVLEKEDAALAIASGFPGIAGAELSGKEVKVSFRDETFDVAGLVRKTVEAGVPVVRVIEDEATLEDVFMQITKGELA